MVVAVSLDPRYPEDEKKRPFSKESDFSDIDRESGSTDTAPATIQNTTKENQTWSFQLQPSRHKKSISCRFLVDNPSIPYRLAFSDLRVSFPRFIPNQDPMTQRCTQLETLSSKTIPSLSNCSHPSTKNRFSVDHPSIPSRFLVDIFFEDRRAILLEFLSAGRLDRFNWNCYQRN